MLEPEELIDSRIGVHDDNQFEVKLDYAIDPTGRRSRYVVETYLFLPRSLGVDAHTYRREQFYSDIQAYIRFKTPTISLRALADEGNDSSPLNQMLAMMPTIGRDTTPDLDGCLGHEVRLFGCLVKVGVRDQVSVLRDRVAALAGRAQHRPVLVKDIDRLALRLADDVSAVLERFRGYRADFVLPRRAAWIQELFAYADEFISLSVERYFTRFIAALDKTPVVRDACEAGRNKIVERILAEQAHRNGAGYDSIIDGVRGSARYVHRNSALKKFMSSVLFLDMTKQTVGRRITHIGAGVAAAVAMLFSTIAAIWSQNRYGINSYPFVVALVISYVFKDRIKEWLRTYFNRQFSRFLWDYSVTIRDPANDAEVGRCREMFSFTDPDSVPRPVYDARHGDATGVLEPKSKPEIILKYVKEITLRGRSIAANHGRLLDVNDIIRFNVSSLLARMDDPVRTVETFDAKTGTIRQVTCPKSYHVNVVMVLRAVSGSPSYERFRVVLDKSGIRELHEVSHSQGAAEAAAPARELEVAVAE